MAHKICAAIHFLITLSLFRLLDIFRSPSDVHFCGLLILASIAATLGCWKRWRWMVALAGVPIMIGGAAAFAVGALFKQMSGSSEMGFLILIAMLVAILEITSFIYAKKPPETPSPDDPDRAQTSILQ
jgi:hypothetical protein